MHEGGRGIDIEVESLANLRRITAEEGARRTNSGAVDEDVDVASCGGDSGHQAGDGIGLGQIAGDMLDRHPVRGRDGGCCPLQAFRVAGQQSLVRLADFIGRFVDDAVEVLASPAHQPAGRDEADDVVVLDHRQMAGAASFARDSVVARIDEADEFGRLVVE